MMGEPLVMKGGCGNQPKQGCANFWRGFFARNEKERRKFVSKRAQMKRNRRNQDT
jgi:hypothetical protein